MNTEELLGQIKKLLEAEREQTRKLIREEVALEGKRITRGQALAGFNAVTSLNRIEDRLKDVEISNTRQENDLQDVKQGQAQTNASLAQTNSIVEAVKAGQDDFREEMQVRLQDLDAKLVKKVQSQERRLDDAGIPNPHKN